MTIEELRYFVEAGKSSSFSAAAEKLHITPQGLSQGIRHLEKKLNVRLFVRTPTGVTLSEIGLQIFEQAVLIFDSLEKIEERVDHHRKNRIKKLHCAVKASRIGNQVKKHLEEFEHVYKIKIEVVDYYESKQVGKISSSHKADIIFEFKELMKGNDRSLRQETLFKSFIQPIVHESNLLAEKKVLSWTDLKAVDLIAESDSHPYVPLVKEKFKELGYQPKIKYCFDAPYCLEVISKNPDSIYFTTEYIFSKFLKGNSNLQNLKCCSISEPVFLEYAAYVKNELAGDSSCNDLVHFMQEKMKHYSSFANYKL